MKSARSIARRHEMNSITVAARLRENRFGGQARNGVLPKLLA